MTCNVGKTDKIIRVIIGIVLLSLLFFLDGNIRYIGLLGIIPILTAIFGYCPTYSLLGISTCHNHVKRTDGEDVVIKS